MGDAKFIQTPRNDGGKATVANTNLDGSGTITNIITCNNPNGFRIDRIKFMCAGTTAANQLRIYLVSESDKRLIHAVSFPASTPTATTTLPQSFDWVLSPPIILEEGYSIAFAPAVAAPIHASVLSGGEL